MFLVEHFVTPDIGIELFSRKPYVTALSRCTGDTKNQVEFRDKIPNNPDMTLRL